MCVFNNEVIKLFALIDVTDSSNSMQRPILFKAGDGDASAVHLDSWLFTFAFQFGPPGQDPVNPISASVPLTV